MEVWQVNKFCFHYFVFQAIEVKLYKISPFLFDKRLASRFSEIAPKKELIHVEIVANIDDKPLVQFYKKTENEEFCLNDYLNFETESMWVSRIY